MRVLLQRVKRAMVTVDDLTVARINTGILALVGFSRQDTKLSHAKVWDKILQKIVNLRIFPDNTGKLNLSVADINGEILLVSQFTLLADCRKGRRPSFSEAAHPVEAEKLFNKFKDDLQRLWPRVQTGIFGAEMDVELCNWGPVTIWLDSDEF
ncbi:D-aminoacyl-tRNA deacylase [Desulfovulcanus sp.]